MEVTPDIKIGQRLAMPGEQNLNIKHKNELLRYTRQLNFLFGAAPLDSDGLCY